MVFREILKEIIEGVEGGIGGLIIGKDGIALETYLKTEGDGAIDIQAFGVELVTSINEFHRAAQALAHSSPRSLAHMAVSGIRWPEISSMFSNSWPVKRPGCESNSTDGPSAGRKR